MGGWDNLENQLIIEKHIKREGIRIMEKADELKKKITRNCFSYLKQGGIPVIQKKCAKIPLSIQVTEDARRKPEVRFFSQDMKKIYMFETISGFWLVLEGKKIKVLDKVKVSGRFYLGALEVSLLKGWSIKIFYTLKNLWKRLGYDFIEGNFEFAFSQSKTGVPFGLTGIVDEKFWTLKEKQKIIIIKKDEKGRFILCPEKLPEMTDEREEELAQIIRGLEKGSEAEWIVRERGWQEAVTIMKNARGWFLVFLEKHPNLIYKKGEDWVEEQIKSIPPEGERTILLGDHSYGKIIFVRKDEFGRVFMFLGHLPDRTKEQEIALAQIFTELAGCESGIKKLTVFGQGHVSEKKFFVRKEEKGRVIIIPPEIPVLTEDEFKRVLYNMNLTKTWRTLRFPQSPKLVTDLVKITELSEKFLV